jgi:uncharacterized membrane protein YgaE (UPF0421/DUF939 family)
MLWNIAWIATVVLGVIGLAIAFVINAKTLRRDLNRRRDAFRARLENEANTMLDDLLNARQVESESRDGGEGQGLVS